MSASSYSQKLLRATIVLPQANFPGTSSNTLTLVGYRMSASVTQAGNFANQLNLAIYGMRKADMDAVTIMWSTALPTTINTAAHITLEASPDGKTWTQVFNGQFLQASPDYSDVPNACLRVLAMTGFAQQVQAAPATAYPGQTSIAQIAQYLTGQMGFAFENNGVTGNLSTPYFSGTYMDQFKALAKHAGIDWYFDGNEILAICPMGQPRQGKPVPVFSPTSGLVGFPSVQRFGIHVDVLFTPALTIGGQIQVTGSNIPAANGKWLVYGAQHDLESLMPGGQWFSRCDCQWTALPTAAAA